MGAREEVVRQVPATQQVWKQHRHARYRTRSSGGSGSWERSGNRGRSQVRSAALFCSLVRGLHLRKHENALVAGMGMHSWGSRGRRFKSGRPDAVHSPLIMVNAEVSGHFVSARFSVTVLQQTKLGTIWR